MDIVMNNIIEIKELIVKARHSGGYVYLPQKWVGKKVKILLFEDIDHD